MEYLIFFNKLGENRAQTCPNCKIAPLGIRDIICLGKGWREVDQYVNNGPLQVGLFLSDLYFLFLFLFSKISMMNMYFFYEADNNNSEHV